MSNLIVINDDNTVSVVLLTNEADFENEAKKIGGLIYEDELPKSDFLIWNEKLKKVEVDEKKELSILKKSKLNEINSLCELSIVGGFKSSALGEEYFYYSTLEEQTTLSSLINLGFDSNFKAQKISLVEGVEVKEERKQYPHTLAQLRQILIDGAIHIKTQIDRKDELEVLINNATTVEELELIEW